LAYRGIDLRDLYRRGSGLTPRRLLALISFLPYEDPVMVLLRADEEQERSAKPTPDRIRDRARDFEERNNRAREVSDGG
jgi:hypothetical protein